MKAANSVFIERMYFYRNEVESCYDSNVSLCAEINSNTGTEFYVPSIKVPSPLYISQVKQRTIIEDNNIWSVLTKK